MANHKSKRDPSTQRDFREKLSDATGIAVPARKMKESRASHYKSGEHRPEHRSEETYVLAMPDKRTIGKDGEGHINCMNLAATTLGKTLSTQNRFPFKHNFAGPFNTMEGFMWYVRTEDDIFRTLNGYNVAVESRQVRYENRQVVPANVFALLVADAIWQQINSNQSVVDKLIASTLPFDMYNVDYTGIRIRIRNANLFAHIFDLCRKALKENQEYPDFTKLFPSNSKYGSEAFNNYCTENKVKQEERTLVYKERVQSIVGNYFNDLIDHDRLKEIRLRETQRDALKASKQILHETSREISKNLKNQGFPEDNKQDLEETQLMSVEIVPPFNPYPSTGIPPNKKPKPEKIVGLPADDDNDSNNSITAKDSVDVTENNTTEQSAELSTTLAADTVVGASENETEQPTKTVGPMDITTEASHLKLIVSESTQLDQDLLTQKMIDRVKNF